MNEAKSEIHQQITTQSEKHLGRLLVESGKLTSTDVDRVLLMQKRNGMRFGEAAVALKMVTQDDIKHALAGQFAYSYLYPGQGGLSPELVVAYQPFSKAAEVIRAVRSQLAMRWLDHVDQKMLAILGTGRKEGRSFFAANLGIVFSQMGARTLLVDADLRNPRLYKIFNLPNSRGLSTLLSGRVDDIWPNQVHCLPNLSVVVSGPVPPNPLELLSQPHFKQFLLDAADKFDVVLVDTPSGDEYSDAQMIASQVGAAVIVTRKHQTRLKPASQIISLLKSSGVEIVGVVANLCLDKPLWDARLANFLRSSLDKFSVFGSRSKSVNADSDINGILPQALPRWSAHDSESKP
jgi:protein-tyrosine kinase